MKKSALRFLLLGALSGLAITALYTACTDDKKNDTKGNSTTKPNESSVVVPQFQADSAYRFVEKQVLFGPRVPGTASHTACGDWMVATLKSYGANVIEQKSSVTTFDGKSTPLRNIIAEFNPSVKKRIALAAHWDTRPFGDKDTDENLWKKPIDGANDGGSGVGVLMEIARLMASNPTRVGVDLIFFDVEDYGAPEWKDESDGDVYTWCLGSQYWARTPHKVGYRAETGILLDMVGAKDAVFNKEGKSMEVAIGTVARVWSTAEKLGYGGFFQDVTMPEIIDDHQWMIAGGVPSIDIVDMRPTVRAMGYEGYGFGSFHHTHNDNMSVISRETLKAVGTTVTHVVYKY